MGKSENITTPDAQGRFGNFGGRYVAETLMPPILELEAAYEDAKADPAFIAELDDFFNHYVGRPSPLYYAERLTDHARETSKDGTAAKIYFKRDELNHTGAHKINNCMGQILLAKRMGKSRIIAETGAGQHGVATATVAARFGLKCIVYMGATDIVRQKPNVFRMRLLGAEVRSVTSGTATLKDAMNEALRDWVTNVGDTFYCIGTVAGPHPYPAMGRGVDTGLHAASLTGGTPGVLHGNRTYLLQDDDGQIKDAHSISAGLDYPGIGPEHAYLHDIGRAEYVSATDSEALEAFQLCSRLEGILPALEPSHAIHRTIETAQGYGNDGIVIMNMCGRGDKDVFQIAEALGEEISAGTDGVNTKAY